MTTIDISLKTSTGLVFERQITSGDIEGAREALKMTEFILRDLGGIPRNTRRPTRKPGVTTDGRAKN